MKKYCAAKIEHAAKISGAPPPPRAPAPARRVGEGLLGSGGE
jgi:hypothetical protein